MSGRLARIDIRFSNGVELSPTEAPTFGRRTATLTSLQRRLTSGTAGRNSGEATARFIAATSSKWGCEDPAVSQLPRAWPIASYEASTT
jgi:hypothetical protein